MKKLKKIILTSEEVNQILVKLLISTEALNNKNSVSIIWEPDNFSSDLISNITIEQELI